MKPFIRNRIGFSFPVPILLIAGLFALAGIVSAVEIPLIGLALISISSIIWSGSYGFEINSKDSTYREYVSIIGIRRGQWFSLEKFPFVAILKVREGTVMYSQTNRSNTLIDDSFGVYLLTSSHRKRVLIKKLDTRIRAERYIGEIAPLINKEITNFSPKLTQKTKMRRRR